MQASASLLERIHAAQLDSIRASRVKAMDETPIKAGRAGPGKMKGAYFWPVYGEQDEICFLYYPSRAAKPVADRFFAWINKQFEVLGFLPSSPFISAPAYIHERRAGLEVYLGDPDVSIDTNHLERALRVIPMGRNYLRSVIMRSTARTAAWGAAERTVNFA